MKNLLGLLLVFLAVLPVHGQTNRSYTLSSSTQTSGVIDLRGTGVIDHAFSWSTGNGAVTGGMCALLGSVDGVTYGTTVVAAQDVTTPSAMTSYTRMSTQNYMKFDCSGDPITGPGKVYLHYFGLPLAPSVSVSGTVTVTPSGTIASEGTKTNNGAVPGANNVGVLPAVATAAAPSNTEGRMVANSQDLAGNLRVRMMQDSAGNAITAVSDGCDGSAKQQFVVNTTSAASFEIANAVVGQYFLICAVNVVAQGAQKLLIAEDDTDGCGSLSAGLNGGTTAATGWSFPADGNGISLGDGTGTVMRTTTTNRYLCFATSTTAQTSGTIIFVGSTQ